MVRAVAASAGLLRDSGQGVEARSPAGSKAGATIATSDQPGVKLGKIVAILVLVFLGVAAASVTLQFTSSWREQLDKSEKNLHLAAELAALKITRNEASGEPAADFSALSSLAFENGRRFLVLDNAGVIRSGQAGPLIMNRPAADLFQNLDAYRELATAGRLVRLHLSNGDMASAIMVRAASGAGTLLAYGRVDDELHLWWQHAGVIGGILLCFGAVTIAFTAVYGLQHQRNVSVGAEATQMSTLAELALEQGQCGLWDWRPGSGRIHWSDAMYRLLGLASEGYTDAARIRARLHEDDAGLLDEINAGIAKGQCEFDRLFRMRDSIGNWLSFRMRAVKTERSAASPARLFAIVMDVTAERALEEESHRADIRLRDAIESLSEAFVLWDENNRLVMCNSKYQSFHGLTDALVQRGAAYKTVMGAAQAPRLMIEIDRGMQVETGARTYEAQFHDGSWLLVSERPTKDGGYVSVGTDITTRKLQESRLVENERKLQMTVTDLGNSREAFRRQAGQLAELADRYLEQKAEVVSANRAKAEFLANMNHEIRTPLNHIIGFAEMIEREVFGPCGSDRYTEYARDIGVSGANLLALFSDILDMARIEAGRVMLDRQSTALGTLLENAAAQVREAAGEKNVAIEIEPDINAPAGLRRINVDPNAISQALAQLLRNSIRLAPAGGRVSIRARMSGDFVNVFVADPGCTLSAGDLGKMVDPFGHIDGMLQDGCKGSGLGVPIARSLIELHGGTMRLRATAQMGSLIMVRLPVNPHAVQLDLPMTA
jgi:two-component system cell cycle sensor histidine kinase PleC